MRTNRDAFFLDTPKGSRFCLVSRPEGPPVGVLLCVPPFAEELNKSRRMLALAAGEYARQGWLVLQMDLFGCGDSTGDFGDASWADWLDDIDQAWNWVRGQPDGPRVLWPVRAGSLLAAAWLERAGVSADLLMWQPVFNGRQHLTQFLRLKAASELLADADARAIIGEVRARLAAGESVEVAGYRLSPMLATGLDAAELMLPNGFGGTVAMLEIGAAERPDPSPALRRAGGMLADKNIPIEIVVVRGSGFWQTQEIETVPALIDASVVALRRFLR